MTQTVLVRHGQTEWNRDLRFRGRTDIDLDEIGRARQVAARWKPVAVYSGPLAGAVHTAEAIAGRCGLHVAVRPHLIDTSFGDWHGLTIEEARAPGGRTAPRSKRCVMRAWGKASLGPRGGWARGQGTPGLMWCHRSGNFGQASTMATRRNITAAAT